MSDRNPPALFTESERKEILAEAESLWKDLQQNDLGGYSGANRPFYILHHFKRVIEKYGNRDVGMTWSRNDLNALEAKPDDAAPASKDTSIKLTLETVGEIKRLALDMKPEEVPKGLSAIIRKCLFIAALLSKGKAE